MALGVAEGPAAHAVNGVRTFPSIVDSNSRQPTSLSLLCLRSKPPSERGEPIWRTRLGNAWQSWAPVRVGAFCAAEAVSSLMTPWRGAASGLDWPGLHHSGSAGVIVWRSEERRRDVGVAEVGSLEQQRFSGGLCQAYAKQSPKFRLALWPLPFPKSR